ITAAQISKLVFDAHDWLGGKGHAGRGGGGRLCLDRQARGRGGVGGNARARIGGQHGGSIRRGDRPCARRLEGEARQGARARNQSHVPPRPAVVIRNGRAAVRAGDGDVGRRGAHDV